MNKFLFELGTEEIPASMIAPGLAQLEQGFVKALEEARLECGRIRTFCSPRRLAVRLEGLPERQADRVDLITGPPSSVALDASGQPTQAAIGFARKMGIDPAQLELSETDRGTYVACRIRVEGRPSQEILREAIPRILAGVSWPKNMYWRENRFRFIRPIRWLVVLWNDEVIEVDFEGVRSGRMTRGHRFLGHDSVTIPSAGQYEDTLKADFVVVDPAEQKRMIQEGLKAATPPGCAVLEDRALLETVCYLNEYPSVLRGGFDSRFLQIPPEILITVMRHHQKYFAVVGGEGELQPFFLAVLNTVEDRRGEICKGHERVLKARLQDAAFFWQNDQKRSLESRVEDLRRIVFQQELGTYFDKTVRLEKLCLAMGGGPELAAAARLSKADLTTEMVFEMPELQGVMGGLYARLEGQPEDVWRAVYEQYAPVSLEDPVPSHVNGALLSIADRLDTIVGCLGVGIVPTGSRDPFGLRRLAQGLVKILLEFKLDFRLDDMIDWAAQGFSSNGPTEALRQEAREFLLQRVRFLFQERGVPYDVLNAVLAVGVSSVPDALLRAEALNSIKSQPDFEAIATSFKRIRNILSGQPDPGAVNLESLVEPSEVSLNEALDSSLPGIQVEVGAGRYLGALKQMAGLRQPVDRFFDDVLVMAEDPALRANRLAILAKISKMFLTVADISEVVRTEAGVSKGNSR